MTLTEFLTARIDEDERRLDAPAFMEADSVRGPGWGDRGDCPICDKYQFEGTESATEDAWYEHVDQAHQRTRVLAECEAKRRIVEHHQYGMGRRLVWPGVSEEAYEVCSACYERSDDGYASNAKAPCMTLRLLALPFADHPDFDEAWRP